MIARSNSPYSRIIQYGPLPNTLRGPTRVVILHRRASTAVHLSPVRRHSLTLLWLLAPGAAAILSNLEALFMSFSHLAPPTLPTHSRSSPFYACSTCPAVRPALRHRHTGNAPFEGSFFHLRLAEFRGAGGPNVSMGNVLNPHLW